MQSEEHKKKTSRRIPKSVLEELLDHLNGIDSLLPGSVLPTHKEDISVPALFMEMDIFAFNLAAPLEQGEAPNVEFEDAELEEGLEYDDEDYESSDHTSIEAEEVEVAVDQMLSDVNWRLIESDRKAEVDSLSELFSRYYGTKSSIVIACEEFEDAINGYLGQLVGEELERARVQLSLIIAFVKKELTRWKI